MKLWVPQFSLEPRRVPWHPFCCSLLLHISVLLFVYQVRLLLPYVPFTSRSVKLHIPSPEQIVYYHLEQGKEETVLPRTEFLRDPEIFSSAGRQGGSELPSDGPAFDPKLTIEIRHSSADNYEQTILQPEFAPDIKIKMSARLPDVVPTSLSVPKPILAPQPEVITIRPASAPAPAQPEPQILMESASLSRIVLPQSTGAVPVLANTETKGTSTNALHGGDPAGLLVLSRTPGPLSEILAVPAGNRYGQFSTSPSASNGKGVNGPNSGGNSGSHDGSVGEGRGGREIKGGGTITVGVSGGVDYSGVGVRGAPSESLTSQVDASVFPIVKPPHIRKVPFLVAAGPGGGGGLNIYGALKGGKIFTIFLRMPGKDWILEYCAPGTGVVQRSNQVTFSESIAPPDAIEEFDFRRTAVRPENQNKLIILKARIEADGSIAMLSVFRGIQPELDELAFQAFAKWRFSPATRGGQPLPVDVLVGIPATH